MQCDAPELLHVTLRLECQKIHDCEVSRVPLRPTALKSVAKEHLLPRADREMKHVGVKRQVSGMCIVL